MRKLCFVLIFAIAISVSPLVVSGQQTLPLFAEAAILVEQTTGRVLYAQNAHQRMYPASTTKLLTALVVMEHLNLDTVVVVGSEIRGMPAGFATNVHIEGEAITVRVLLQAFLMRSSNESGRVLALEVVRTVHNDRSISYTDAKPRFSTLMNDFARALGAENSNFNNPYGLHSEQHFTTAYDLALVGRAFAENPILMQISATREFYGDSMEGRTPPYGSESRQLSFGNTNQMLPGATFGHPYITGGRTGFTSPAGHCFVGLAYHNGLGLVSVVLNSQENTRWQDTRLLIDHGFFNYSFREVGEANQLIDTVKIENPRLGDIDTLDVRLQESRTFLLSHAEYAAIERTIVFSPLFLVESEDDEIILNPPIEYDEVVGTVTYRTGGEILFSTSLLADRDVQPRTFDSDMDYYMDMFFSNMFTRRALPYWFGTLGTLFGFIGMFAAFSAARRAKRLERWDQPDRRRRYR